jgi:hypothetical protein
MHDSEDEAADAHTAIVDAVTREAMAIGDAAAQAESLDPAAPSAAAAQSASTTPKRAAKPAGKTKPAAKSGPAKA